MFPERMPRVESLMQQEISLLLESFRERLQEKAPNILLTVTKVQVDRNFDRAMIYYSWTRAANSSSQEEAAELAQEALNSILPELVRELRDRVRVRKFPRFSFVYDETLESADRVYQILHQIEREREVPVPVNAHQKESSAKKYAGKKDSPKT